MFLKSWIKTLHNEWTYKMQFPSKCLICDKSFQLKWKSKKLVDWVHDDDSHNCRICDKSFSHHCDLKKHVEKVHEIGRTIEKSKSPSYNKSCSKIGESKYYTMNELIKCNPHPSV